MILNAGARRLGSRWPNAGCSGRIEDEQQRPPGGVLQGGSLRGFPPRPWCGALVIRPRKVWEVGGASGVQGRFEAPQSFRGSQKGWVGRGKETRSWSACSRHISGANLCTCSRFSKALAALGCMSLACLGVSRAVFCTFLEAFQKLRLLGGTGKLQCRRPLRARHAGGALSCCLNWGGVIVG